MCWLFSRVLAFGAGFAQVHRREDWNAKALALRAQGKPEEAIAAFNKAIAASPKLAPMALVNKGALLRGLGKYDEAMQAFDKAIELDPNHPHAWYDKGVLLWQRGDPKAALTAFDMTIKLRPDEALPWLNRSVVLIEVGQAEAALQSIDQGLALNANLDGAWYIKKASPRGLWGASRRQLPPSGNGRSRCATASRRSTTRCR